VTRLLLDTHVVLWMLEGSDRLGPETRLLIGESEDVAVSVASLWETAIKKSLGRLPTLRDIDDVAGLLTLGGVRRLDIDGHHLRAVTQLPWQDGHRDPFDRMLIAQAQTEGMAVVTADRKFDRYDIQLYRPHE
jgi:PIN domain nuclease of toxin-antitoxin system